MSDLGLRIVEAEQAPCQHMHSGNYDPAKVVKGQPVEPLPNNQHKCFDCGELFTLQLPASAAPKYTLKEIEALAHEFIGEPEIDNYERRLLLSVFVQWLARREREGRG